MGRRGASAGFIACWVVAGLAALALGQDASADLRNHHFYNAFALLNGRLGWDLAPAQVQGFLNPLADLPFYALTRVVSSPQALTMALALPAAIAAFFLLRTLARLFPGSEPHRLLSIAAAAAIGLTTATGSGELGSAMTQWTGAALVLAALAVALGSLRGGEGSLRAIALAAFLAGCAAGAKPSHGAFLVGLLAAFAACGGWRERLGRLAAAGVGALAGVALTYGYWGWMLQQEYGSPVFPFFNEFFKSPWWEIRNWSDHGSGPATPLDMLVFPYALASGAPWAAPREPRDARLAALSVVALLVLLAIASRRRRPRLAFAPPDPRWTFLCAFALVSYLASLAVFRQHRALLPLEMVSGALVVGGAAFLLRRAALRRAAIVLLAVGLVATTRPPAWERIAFGERPFAVVAPPLDADALVVIPGDIPASYAIAFFRRDARFVSAASNFIAPGQRNLLARKVAAVIARHEGPLYVLEARSGEFAAVLAAHRLVKRADTCLPLRSNLDADALQVCRLGRAG